MRAEPLSCWRPTPERAADFASPPYDVFDRRQAASYVAAHPGCFLEIDRPETAFGPSQDMYAPEVYAKAAELMRLRTSDGTLVRDETACYYIYRLEQGGHSQTGIVCACSANEYLDGTIRRHESTRHEKERDRIEHIRTTGAQSGPIFLTYRDSYALDVLVRSACTGSPLYDFTDEGGVRQTVWRIARPDAVAAIQAAFATVPCAYIADGHHRAASAVAVSLERRRAHGRGQGRESQSVPRDARADGDDIGTGPTAGTDPGADEAMMAERPWDLFLSVLFPASQLCVLPYNRVVRDRGGLSVEGLVGRIEAAGFKAGPPRLRPSSPTPRGAWDSMRTAAGVSSRSLEKPTATPPREGRAAPSHHSTSPCCKSAYWAPSWALPTPARIRASVSSAAYTAPVSWNARPRMAASPSRSSRPPSMS